MPGSLNTYATINARLRTRLSRMLSDDFLRQLQRTPSLPECVQLLRETAYAALEPAYSTTGDIRMAELALLEEEIQLYLELEGMSGGPLRRFIGALVDRFEVDTVKNALRLWFDAHVRGHAIGAAAGYLYRKPIHHDLKLDAIVNAGDLDAVTTALDGTPYRSLVATHSEEVDTRQSLFPLELALDRHYHEQLAAAVSGLNRRDRRVAGRILGTQVDWQNVLWIMRVRRFYRNQAEAEVTGIIPGGCYLSEAALNGIESSEAAEALLAGIVRDRYPSLREKLAAAGSAGFYARLTVLEELLDDILNIESRRALCGYPFTVGMILAYFILKSAEIHRLVSLLNAKAYGVDAPGLGGGIMMFTERMKQLVAVVLDRDSERVTRALLKLGVLDLVKITKLDVSLADHVADVAPKVSEAMIAEIRKRIESFLDMIGEQPGRTVDLDVDNLAPVDLDATTKDLDSLGRRIREIRDQQEQLQQEILKLEEIERQVELFDDLPFATQSPYAFLTATTGSIRNSSVESFQAAFHDIPCVLVPMHRDGDRTAVLLIYMRRDEAEASRILDKFGWVDVQLPEGMGDARDEVVSQLKHKLDGFRKAQDKRASEIISLVRDEREHLEQLWANLRLNELFVKIQASYSRTARTILVSGWVPADTQETVDRALRDAAGGCCYLEWQDPPEETDPAVPTAPVQLRRSRLMAPFQMLVRNFTIPEYGTVDPTPFTAVTYLTMFGLMFGDVGHGAVILSIGLLGLFLKRQAPEGRRNLFCLIAWCGGAAMVAGALFGSYFGMPWLPPLWFDYHGLVTGHGGSGAMRSVYDILRLTVYFGIAVIGCGLVLNWINLVAKRRWIRLVFDKAGIVGGWAYAGGVYLGFYFVRHSYKELPGTQAVFLLVGLPCVLLAVNPVVHMLHEQHRAGRRRTSLVSRLFIVIMEWLIEILELVSGYLANTLSFMRVAGLGIAHVSLVVAFALMADNARTPSGSLGIGSWVILVLGHTLIIALEGLSAAIQSLRLNYYEFFSKYLSGSGRAYAPVSLGRKT